MKHLNRLALVAVILALATGFPLYTGGNSWPIKSGTVGSANFTFSALPASFITYFYTDSQGVSFDLSILMNASVQTNVSVTIGSSSRTILVNAKSNFSAVNVGSFLSTSGYNQIIVQISSTFKGSGKVYSFEVTGDLQNLTYVRDNTGSNFYWGRRGSSANISPSVGTSKNITYFYSEIYVPSGFDPVASYYMANGFGQGYFGIQVNSLTERRVLFSVWSGFVTDDPTQIPKDYTVSVDRIGPGVTNGTFGGEGSGAQTYLVFNWTAGQIYKFLTKAEPQSISATTYTSWFNDPTNTTNNGWRLISQMTRPKIQTYLKGIYSFIECFNPEKGNVTRMGYYGNQWYYDETKTWKESTTVTYGEDDAGRTNIRRDVDGGVFNRNMFFMRNGGFFNTTSKPGTKYTRIPNGVPPAVDFAALP